MTSPSAALPLSDRERLDATILRALGVRRNMRAIRTAGRSAWDTIERTLVRVTTILWESEESAAHDDLLAYCAYIARELEVTESMDIPFEEEESRLDEMAPQAIATLDDLTANLEIPELLEALDDLRMALGCPIGYLQAA